MSGLGDHIVQMSGNLENAIWQLHKIAFERKTLFLPSRAVRNKLSNNLLTMVSQSQIHMQGFLYSQVPHKDHIRIAHITRIKLT